MLFLLLGGLVVLAWVLYQPLTPNPLAEKLINPADKYQVEIIRDQWGIPHIVGETDADASYGLAYAHAEDDFATIQETVAATRGHLARYRGRSAAATDYLVALFGIWPTLAARYQTDVPEDVKALASAYADGLNQFAARNPDQTWQGLAPFKPQDIIAGFMFKTPFFYGLDKTLLALFGDAAKAEIALAPQQDKTAWQLQATSRAELGSNAMAVNAQRSGDGKTRLLINSHQPMTGPVAWYEAHLISAQGLDISGGLFPGTPIILHGFNRNLGWANTVNHIDLADVYVLTRNPENELQYRLDDQWVDFAVSQVKIKVKLFGPFMFTAKRQVLRSAHGPVIENNGTTYALRYAGMGEVRQLEQYYRLNQAADLEGFMSAMALNALPSINYVYADKEDNIAFIHNAQYPNRLEGWEWSKYLPGDRSDLIWRGYRPFQQVPKLINPQSGMLFNANNTPFSATDGPDNLQPQQFPASMGLATNQTNRSLRLMELNNGENVLRKDQVLLQKFDNIYSQDSQQVRIIKQISAMDFTGQAVLSNAAKHLSEWDHATDKQNRHTALAVSVLRKVFVSNKPVHQSPAQLREALQSSVDYLLEKYARIDPLWGEVNRLIRGDVNLPIDGGPDVLRAIYSIGQSEQQHPKATHGDTWMALVEWDSSGNLSADVMHQFGSATNTPGSAHYADQAALFAAGKWRKAQMELSEIRANAERSYWPNRSD